MLKHLW